MRTAWIVLLGVLGLGVAQGGEALPGTGDLSRIQGRWFARAHLPDTSTPEMTDGEEATR